jgi:hypothetical protein
MWPDVNERNGIRSVYLRIDAAAVKAGVLSSLAIEEF